MEAAAPMMPGVPSGAKGSKRAPSITGTDSAMNISRAAIFTTTSTALSVALSLVPRTSKAVTAGRCQ